MMPRSFSALVLLLVASSMAQSKLGQYHINPDKVSVSGISSGGYMAVQMHIAFSETIKHGGSIAGGPYYCAQASVSTALSACMSSPNGINTNQLVSYAKSASTAGTIDNLSNLANSKIYIFHSPTDGTVAQGTSDKHQTVMKELGVQASNILVNYDINAGHSMVTDFYGNGCTTSRSPYINNCEDGDIAGELLDYFHGPLNARGVYQSSNLIKFDQSEFRAPSMSSTAYVYVPDRCANDQVSGGCGLHIALHGCQQNHENSGVGTKFVEFTGYNEYAETNDFIILYPQTEVSYVPNNPNACWDWWGYAGTDYCLKSGAQMASIKDMIDRIMSGTPSVPVPGNLRVTNATDHTISLAWASVPEAVRYVVYRDYEDIAFPTTTSFTDTNLQSGTEYVYTVAAENADGHRSPESSPVAVSTSGPPPPLEAPDNFNSNHVGPDYVELLWDKVNGASYYTVDRDGVDIVNTTYLTFTDQGLQPETVYVYTVYAGNQYEQGPSATPVVVETGSDWTCNEYFDNNYNHVQQNHAYTRVGYVYAIGSDQLMGLYNIGAYTRLAETSEGYFEIGTC